MENLSAICDLISCLPAPAPAPAPLEAPEFNVNFPEGPLVQVDSLFPNFHSVTEGGDLGLQNVGGDQDNALQNVGGDQTFGDKVGGAQLNDEAQIGDSQSGFQTGGSNQAGLLSEAGEGDNVPLDLELTGGKLV